VCPDESPEVDVGNCAWPDRTRPDLDQLIRENPALWRGRDSHAARPGGHVVDTGFDALNRLLPNGGWPLRAVIEITVTAWGNGELQLLLPLIARLTADHNRVAMVAPPYRPYAPALVQGGVALPWLLVVDCENRGSEEEPEPVITEAAADAPSASRSRQRPARYRRRNIARNVWWSAEKLLRHPECGLVLVWPPSPDPAQVRRLQLAADASDGIGVIFRCGKPVDTPVGLRIKASRRTDGVEVILDKSRYGWRQHGAVVLPVCPLAAPSPASRHHRQTGP